MEAVHESSQLEVGLTASFANLNFDNGKPVNDGEVIASMTDIILTFFQNGGIADGCWTYIRDAFATIKGKFSDDNECMLFVYKAARTLKHLRKHYNECATTDDSRKIDVDLTFCADCFSEIGREIEIEPIRLIEAESEAIDWKQPIETRFDLAQKLRGAIVDLASTGKLLLDSRSSDEDEVITTDRARTLGAFDHMNFRSLDGSTSGFTLHGTLQKICAIEIEKQLMDAIGKVDKAQIKKDSSTFGAKGANLLEVQRLLPKFENTWFEYAAKRISVPNFRLLDVELYKQWLAGKDVSDELKAIFADFEGKALMVRSSAVYSEDGDSMTGAGIYLSVALDEGASFEEFKHAVFDVYESCESDEAKNYRMENNVEQELMGVVIQERIVFGENGYINSTRPYTDDIIDVKDNSGHSKNVFDAETFDIHSFLDRSKMDTVHIASRVQPDTVSIMHTDCFNVVYIATFARILEKYYGQPVQIEYSEESDWMEGATFHFFQVRPLPPKMFTAPDVEFPKDLQHIYECSAEGVCDQVLDVLSVFDNNDENEGFAIYMSSWMGSFERGWIHSSMPKKGAVMVWQISEPGRGHIETLALERGITLLFHDETGRIPEDNVIRVTREKIWNCMTEKGSNGNFAGHKKVRIVSNGKVGRIYPVNEQPENFESPQKDL